MWRAPATVTLPILERYAAGSYRSELRWNPGSAETDRTPQPVRVVTVDLARRLPNSESELYPDAAHGGIFQFHRTFVPRILEFLAR